jgi:transposase-like protein
MDRKGSTISELASTRWDTRIARRVVGTWQQSGMTGAAFARAHGIKKQRLSRWRKKLGQEQKGVRRQVAAAAFLPVAVTDLPAIAPAVRFNPGVAGTVMVRLPGGVEVEAIGVAALPAAWLAGVVRELARLA